MSKITIKNLPRLRLSDLLRRRKMTLDWFIQESGVQTYEALCSRCRRLGVQPPPKSDWTVLRPDIVSSPSDGVVVLDPPDIIEESTGRRIDPEAPVTLPGIEVITKNPPKDGTGEDEDSVVLRVPGASRKTQIKKRKVTHKTKV